MVRKVFNIPDKEKSEVDALMRELGFTPGKFYGKTAHDRPVHVYKHKEGARTMFYANVYGPGIEAAGRYCRVEFVSTTGPVPPAILEKFAELRPKAEKIK